MKCGYMGKMLRINLNTNQIEIEELREDIARKYIGGSGLGARILFRETSLDTNPLGPENILIFMTGPLTGTRAFSSDRFEVITKSPLTGIYAEAGIWYDAVAGLCKLIDDPPKGATLQELRQQRAALLEQVKLQEVAAYDRQSK